MKQYDSVSAVYNAIENGEANFIDLLDFISKRESEAWDNGYNAAKSLYEPLLFSDKVEV